MGTVSGPAGHFTMVIPTHTHTHCRKSSVPSFRFYRKTLLHTETFTHKRVYTQELLHTDPFTHRRFYTQTLLHTDPFTHRHFYTRFYAQTLLHTETFTHRRFYTQTLFTHRGFYTQKLLHTNTFTHRDQTPEIAILPPFLAIEPHFATPQNRNFTSVFNVQRQFRAKRLRWTN